MTDLKALEALIKRRLRETAEQDIERSQLNKQFAAAVAAYRLANPASVSPRVGFA